MAQFYDPFEGPINDAWTYNSGDGAATIDFTGNQEYATIIVDATDDQNNIWWALIRRNVAPQLDLSLLSKPTHELRVETRIKASHSPRRVNLHFNTQKTTDFHSHLMEYDIDDTTNWHTISMTTEGFEAVPGDTVNAQMALIDWGPDTYKLQVDYFKVDIVDTDTTRPDIGNPVPYNPPIPELSSYNYQEKVSDDTMVDLRFPEINFNGWYAISRKEQAPTLTVSGGQFSLLRWDLESYVGRNVEGYGVLEITTQSLQRMETGLPEFGQVRVVEILADKNWSEETVTLKTLSGGKNINKVFNPQMVIDVAISPEPGSSTKITINEPVLQRLIDGETTGLALRPLGPITATFFASEYEEGSYSATLHFNLSGDD
ncbi:MAG: hypothetical protein U5K69_17920 [Balneolaceae bacterium]|nr:hypothetical protein [Balneolaceae bacterium]